MAHIGGYPGNTVDAESASRIGSALPNPERQNNPTAEKAEGADSKSLSRVIDNPRAVPLHIRAAREACTGVSSKTEQPTAAKSMRNFLPLEIWIRVAKEVWHSSAKQDRLWNIGNMRAVCQTFAVAGAHPIKYASVLRPEQKAATEKGLSPGGFEEVYVQTPYSLRLKDEDFFEGKGKDLLLENKIDEFRNALKNKLDANETLYVPFHVFPKNNTDVLKNALRALRATCGLEGTVEYDFGGKSGGFFEDFGASESGLYPELQPHKQHHSWDTLKKLLPVYLGNLGKRPLSVDSEGKPTSWAANEKIEIHVDLLGVSSKHGTFSPNFIELMSKLGTANLSKLRLNAYALFERRGKYWPAVVDMMCTEHQGSRLEELVLQFEQTYITTDEHPTVRREWMDVSRMVQEKLAEAIGRKTCKVKVLRLPRLYFEGGESLLNEKLQERKDNGWSDIQIFGGYNGDVPLNELRRDLSMRDQFPSHSSVW